MPDPVVHITAGIPDSGTGNITTLGQTLLDGANLTLGATTDVAATGVGTVNAHLRSIATSISAGITISSGSITAAQGSPPWTVRPDGTTWTQTGTSANVNITNASIAVTGTFFQATQPVSIAAAVTVQQSTAANLNATVVGTGTFAVQAAQSGTWNITNISGTVSLPTGAATSANQCTAAAIGSATSGQTGHLAFGATTTAAPTYTTAQSNPLSLDTSGNLRTSASQSGTWNITNISGTVSLPTGAATSANQPTAAAQGSATSGQTGNLVQGAVTTASPTYTTGQTSPLSLDTSGNLRVNVVAGGASGGTSSTFGAAFPGTGTAIGVMNSAATAMTNLKANASNALVVDGSAVTQPVSGTVAVSGSVTVAQATAANLNATVVGTGTFAVQAAQSGTWNIGSITTLPALPANQSVNVAQINGVTPLMGNGVTGTGSQRVTIASDNTAFSVNANQAGTWNIGTVTTITNPVAATQSGTWTVQQGTPPWAVQGDVASGATDSGNPIKVGGVARTANPTAVAAGQRVNAMFDKLGKQVVVSGLREAKGVQKTSISVGTETTVVTAGGAGVFNDVYAIIVTNKSATSVFVDFRDATAGTVRTTIAAPANDTRGLTLTVDSAMIQAVAANAWTATVSSAVSSIEITMLFVSNL